MRVPLRWLSDYIDLPTADPAEIGHALDMLGHGVEGIEKVTAEWTDVVVGRVDRIEPHPDADKVRVTFVDLGDGELHQIICGAWNFEAGAVVPVAVPGAVLPGEFEIGRRRIRGVESHGMICSERELRLGDDAAGIMVLPPDTPLGVPFASALDLPDVVFDLDITNNRPDVMSMVGVARELAAWFEVPYRKPEVLPYTVAGTPSTSVTISAPDGCNRFVAREIRGVAVGPSPLWMRERLRRAGVRAISNVVDVTNYVMLELGHPLHAFDAARIAGDRLDVRWAEEGETLTTLDDVERVLSPADLVIVDADGPTSLAAVMGGARSEVGDTTTRVLMEAASWHAATVMYTSRRHDLRSEASARFERGVDPNLSPDANARACRLLVEIAGGEVLADVVDVVANVVSSVSITLPIGEVERVLGDRYTVASAAAALERLELAVEIDGDHVDVTVPTNRPDLTRPADLIEELARLADYDTFPETLPTGPAGGLSAEQRRLQRLHDLLRGLGLYQAVNLPFVAPEELEVFSSGGVVDVVNVRNPLRDDQSKLRQSLLPGLLRNARDNLNRGAGSVAMFETGRVFFARPWDDDPRVPEQPMRLGVVAAGPFGGAGLGRPQQPADATVAFAVLTSVATQLGTPLERRAARLPGLHPMRSAEVILDGRVVGVAGELDPDAAAVFEIDGRVAVVELALSEIVTPPVPRQMTPLSTFPHVDFDLSFDVPESVTAVALVAATSAVSTFVESSDVFDEYRPESGQGRSMAVRYRLRALDRTLGGDDLATVRAAMIEAAGALGATLRGAATKEGA